MTNQQRGLNWLTDIKQQFQQIDQQAADRRNTGSVETVEQTNAILQRKLALLRSGFRPVVGA